MYLTFLWAQVCQSWMEDSMCGAQLPSGEWICNWKFLGCQAWRVTSLELGTLGKICHLYFFVKDFQDMN